MVQLMLSYIRSYGSGEQLQQSRCRPRHVQRTIQFGGQRSTQRRPADDRKPTAFPVVSTSTPVPTWRACSADDTKYLHVMLSANRLGCDHVAMLSEHDHLSPSGKRTDPFTSTTACQNIQPSTQNNQHSRTAIEVHPTCTEKTPCR